jgi:ABC-type amino acid transport substrate-binding protein
MSQARPIAQPALARLLLLGCWLAIGPAQAGPAHDRIQSTGEVVLAHRESSVPFSVVGPAGKPMGYAVDLCLKMVEVLRQQLSLPRLETRFVMVTQANRIATIEQGKADLECGSTTDNAQRREKVAFTELHYITGAHYLVHADSKIQVLGDFEGRKLVATKGTKPLKVVNRSNTEYILGINLLEAPDHAHAIDMVASREVDGFVMDDVLIFGLMASLKEPQALKMVGRFLTTEPLAIMLPRSDPELKKLVDDEMKRLIRSQKAYGIYEHWFQKPISHDNRSLNPPMNYLHKDFWRYPTDKVLG